MHQFAVKKHVLYCSVCTLLQYCFTLACILEDEKQADIRRQEYAREDNGYSDLDYDHL